VSAVLVDTHIALWALGDPARLTDQERALMIDPAVDRCLSPMSVWEAAIKRQAGRLRAPQPERAARRGVPLARRLSAAARSRRRAATSPRRPVRSRPDRPCLEDDLRVLTRDDAFAEYGVRLVATST
jgi:PIN domain nuclease of toxin-antitoxin system